MSHYDQYRKNIHSQNGEDGVIAQLIRELPGIPHSCVDVGANDGVWFSNTLALLETGWRGVLIDADADCMKLGDHPARRWPDRVTALSCFVRPTGPDSLGAILEAQKWPSDLGLWSSDTEGLDYLIWRDLPDKWRPWIVVIEVNGSANPDQLFFPPGDYISSMYCHGASFRSMVTLAWTKGYVPVAMPGNVIFVASELVHKLSIPAAELANPSSLFNWEFGAKR